jgi:hypothetical protein
VWSFFSNSLAIRMSALYAGLFFFIVIVVSIFQIFFQI